MAANDYPAHLLPAVYDLLELAQNEPGHRMWRGNPREAATFARGHAARLSIEADAYRARYPPGHEKHERALKFIARIEARAAGFLAVAAHLEA